MTLYEINNELARLMEEAVDEETGEIREDAIEEIENMQMAWDEKVENIGCFIKNLKADAEALKAEKMNLGRRQQVAENKAERLQKYLMDMLAGQTYQSPRVAIGYRKGTTVQCDDIFQVPEEYLRYKDPELDKKAIKDALKNGTEVPGCHLEETRNIQIK